MPDQVAETPVLLIKKMGGLLLLIVGFLLAALGYENGSNGLAMLGIVLVAIGIVLLVLKIFRRNQA
jgi:uncharacterized membrane protein YidH (DUF202 family)